MNSERYYFDTSAWFKRFFDEKHSEDVRRLLKEAKEVAISEVALPELFSNLRRLVRDGLLTQTLYLEIKENVRIDLKGISILPLNSQIVSEAIRCVEEVPLKGCDSIHVASALIHRCGLFVSADQQQCAAAKKLGLNVKIL